MKGCLFSFVIGAIVCCNSFVFAKTSVQPGITFGLSSFNYYYGNDLNVSRRYDSRTGLVPGILLDIAALNVLSIEPGVLFSMRGIKNIIQVNYSDTAIYSENFSYLAIPVHAKLKYPSLIVKPYALAGLNVGFLLAAKEKREGGGDSYPYPYYPIPDESDIQDVHPVDLGLDFGAGVEFNLISFTPFIEFVYYFGLINMVITTNFSQKNIGWELKGGLKVKI
jgi:hypothetical protein